MALARWSCLCIDAREPSVVGGFWAGALGLEVGQPDGGDLVLRGKTAGQTVWVNSVDEAKSGKNRVHLDLVRSAVGDVALRSARALQEVSSGERSWTVMADPGGAEFCVFAQDDAPTALVVDSGDPEADASWWAGVLGATAVEAPGGLRRWVAGVEGLPWDVVKFVGVDEPKTVKNRVHWDVESDDVAGLVAAGARVLRRPGGDVSWHVLADPAGNEFCVPEP